MRIFTAVNISKDFLQPIQNYLDNWEEKYKDFRWIHKKNMHITLNFFGEMEEDGLVILEKAIEKSVTNISKFIFSAGGFLYLPHGLHRIGSYTYQKTIKVFALRIEKGKNEFEKIFNMVEDNLIIFGKENNYSFRPKERRPYVPHITIARKGRFPMENYLSDIKDVQLNIEGIADNVTIFKSELFKGNPNRQQKEIPKYTPLKVFNLK